MFKKLATIVCLLVQIICIPTIFADSRNSYSGSNTDVIKGLPPNTQCVFSHYSTENGLSQNKIMYMLQDHQGFMWFATWDGLSRFDGYDFITYKASPNNNVCLTSNRIDWIGEDKQGYIWLLSFDKRPFRFNPKRGSFENVMPKGVEDANIKQIKILNNNIIWLLSNNSAYRIILRNKGKFEVIWHENKKVQSVCLDSKQNEWVLTDNGISLFHPHSHSPQDFFINKKDPKENLEFFSICERNSHVYISSNKGLLWKYDENSKRFTPIKLPTSETINDVGALGKYLIVATTAKKGFYIYDTRSGHIFSYTEKQIGELKDLDIKSVYVDKKDLIWFNVQNLNTVCRFNFLNGQFNKDILKNELGESVNSNPNFHIHEDIYGNLWIQPRNGNFSLYDRKNNCLVPFFNDYDSPSWRFSDKLHAAMSDRQGNLWLCTHSKGLEKISFIHKQFEFKIISNLKKGALANSVRTMYQDQKGNFWFGLKNGQISVFDIHWSYLGYLTEQGTISKQGVPIDGVAYSIMQDHRGIMWIGTRGKGLLQMNEKSPFHYEIKRYIHKENDIYSISDNSIYSLYEDRFGHVWVGTFGGGLNYIDQETEARDTNDRLRFIHYHNNLKNFPSSCIEIRQICPDKAGNIWLGTTQGAVCFKSQFKIPENIYFQRYKRRPGNNNTLANNDIFDVVCTKKGEIFFATFGGGLSRLIHYPNGKVSFKSYTRRNDIPSDVLISAVEDNEGFLWIASDNGLCRFDPINNHCENFSGFTLGQTDIQYDESSAMKDRSGRLYFGTGRGYISFSPKQIKKSSFIPPIVFSHLYVQQSEAEPDKDDSPLSENINYSDKVTLKPSDKIFSIVFSALDLSDNTNIKYMYMLDGFDKNWQLAANGQHQATYTNLPKGTYTFRVRSTNADGIWIPNERALSITMKPTFWETYWAYGLYFLILTAITCIIAYILFIIYRLKHEVSIEKQIAEIKLRFFTNISHELRTPLTLISAPLECAIDDKQLTPLTKQHLMTVKQNTSRMLNLVDQILDFRKIQNHKMKLCVQRTDIVTYVRNITENFQALADEHHIDLIFESEKDSIFIWVDTDKLEKIIFNLISNAFKYTLDGKTIQIFIYENEQNVSIEVKDNGIGIPENKKNFLFKRFENHLNGDYFTTQSTGIGLSLVKELADLHKASISFESRQGQGSTFTVSFKKGKDYFDDTVEYILNDGIGDKEEKESAIKTENTDDETKNRFLLIVEDDSELRKFLKSLFSSSFKVYEASNGEEGLEQAQQIIPDIIISDVMMTKMDGLEMTKRLRTDISTSHIPVILLTAKAMIENKLEGLETGADDYITKPFSASYLKARVENLLLQRIKLRNLFTANLLNLNKNEKPVMTTGITQNDQDFIAKVTDAIEKNIDNSGFTVEDLVKGFAMSRTVFFKKLKVLTGLSPIEFIRTMRIRRAAQLIETSDFNMSQISYMVGINGSRYFSRCFKQMYGLSPTEYKDKLKRETE